jgi:hypothetical protein
MPKTGRFSVMSPAATPLRHALAGRVTPTWQARAFYTASTPPILQRSRLRRELVPRSPVSSLSESNDLSRLNRLGELLLRVVRVARVCGGRFRVRTVGPRRARAAGDHPREHLRRHGHSSDGKAGAAQQGRGVRGVSAACESVRSDAAEAHASGGVTDPAILSGGALRFRRRRRKLEGARVDLVRNLPLISLHVSLEVRR